MSAPEITAFLFFAFLRGIDAVVGIVAVQEHEDVRRVRELARRDVHEDLLLAVSAAHRVDVRLDALRFGRLLGSRRFPCCRTLRDRRRVSGRNFVIRVVVGVRLLRLRRSNHSNGNAVDLQVLIKGGDGIVHNTYDDQSGWHASWAFWWLKEHAKEFGFKNYIKEAWHWEWYA